MRNVSLITLFLIGILMIPQVVDSSGARNAGDFEDDMLEGRVKAESDDPIWPMECGNPKHTGLSDFLFGDNPGKIKKTFSQEICMTPVVGSDGVIYSGGVLSFFAIYPNGTTKWEYTQDRAISTAAIQKDGSIVFANYSRSLVCLHSSNGTKRWVMPGNFRNTPTIGNDGTIYVTGIHNSAYALFALNPDGTERWNYSMGALSDQYSSPAVDDNGTVYIGYSNYSNTPSSSHLCAIHPNGTLRWERQMEHSPITTPSIGPNNEIYVGQAMNLYAFDTNGTEIFNYSTLGYRGTTPIMGPDGTIYFGSNYYPNFFIYAIDKNGNLKWSYKTDSAITSAGTVSRDGVLIFPDSTNLYALDPDGSLIWKIKRWSDYYMSPVLFRDGEIYYTSEIELIIIGKTPPTPPRITGIRSGDSFINISWIPPFDDGGTSLLEYRIFKGTSSGDTTFLASFDNKSLFFEDTDVINGVRYYYRLNAVNAEGASVYTDEVSDLPLARPTPPRNLTAMSGDNFICITWSPPEDIGGSTITDYDIYRGLSEGSEEHFTNVVPSKNVYNDTDVEVGLTYYYYMTSSNSVGASDPTDVVIGIPKTEPSAPTNFTAIDGDGFVRIGWSSPTEDGGSPLLGYRIYRGQISVSDGEIIVEVGSNITKYNDTSVTNGISYFYYITAFTEIAESFPTMEILANPLGIPSCPTEFRAIPGDGYADLSWELPTSDGGSEIQHFSIYRSGGSEGEKIFPARGSLVAEYRDEPLMNGVTYCYRISAVNQIGESNISDEVEVMPKGVPTIPRNISVHFGSGFVHISWIPPRSDEGAPITEYKICKQSNFFIFVNGSQLEYNDTDVENGNFYYYYVIAVNSVGESGKSDSVRGDPFEVSYNVPTPPRNPTGQIINTTVFLEWDPPSDNGGLDVIGYKVYRRFQGEELLIFTLDANHTSATDTDLISGEKYYYYMTAKNAEGESNPSEEVRIEVTLEDDPGSNDTKSSPVLVAVLILIVIVLIAAGIGAFMAMKKRKVHEEQPAYDFDTIRARTGMNEGTEE